MKVERRHIELHNEPPAVLLVDMAFNLLIFFVVCASTEPQDGRKQAIPGSSQDAAAQAAEEPNNVEVALTKTTASINGEEIKSADFKSKLQDILKSKPRVEDRVVVVKSTRDTPYTQWIRYTGLVQEAGGITTLQLEEEADVQAQ